MKLLGFFLFVFLNTWELYAQKIEYLQVIARPGDDVTSLLSLYQLNKYDCNLKSFYKINELSERQYLYANKVYFLPVRVFKYDDKSIRSTIGINNWDKAKRIQSYNVAMLKTKLRLTDYVSSKILWVPLNELDCKAAKATDKKNTPKTDKKTTTSVINRETPQTAVGNRIFPIFGKKTPAYSTSKQQIEGSGLLHCRRSWRTRPWCYWLAE